MTVAAALPKEQIGHPGEQQTVHLSQQRGCLVETLSGEAEMFSQCIQSIDDSNLES